MNADRPAQHPDMTRSTLLAALLTVLVCLTAVIWSTWPVATDPGQITIGRGDAWPSAWQLNWLQHALLSPTTRMFDANIYFPYDRTLTSNDLLLTHALWTLPLAWAPGPLLVYNLALLGGIVLCAAFGFGLFREVSGSDLGASLGALAFALAPFRFLHIQHLSIAAAWAAPLLCWALLRQLRGPSWPNAVLVAVAAVATAGSSLYQILYLAPLLPLLSAWGAGRGSSGRRAWTQLLVTGLPAALVILMLALPYARAQRDFGVPWSPHDLQRYAADLVSVAAAPIESDDTFTALTGEARLYPGHGLATLGLASFAAWVASVLGRTAPRRRLLVGVGIAAGAAVIELVTPGAPIVLLLIWALPAALWVAALHHVWRGGTVGAGPALRLGLAGGASSWALALGPVVQLFGEPIGPGPYSLLLSISSVYASTRAPARFAALALMFLGLAAAGFCRWLQERELSPSVRPTALALVAVVAVGGTTLSLPREGWGLSRAPDTDTDAYRWLRDKPGDFGILELPEPQRRSYGWDRATYMLNSRAHWKRLVNGTGGWMPPLQRELYNSRYWSEPFFGIVRAYFPVRYVLVHGEGTRPRIRNELLPRLADGHQGWRQVYQSGEDRIFVIDRSFDRGTSVERLYLRSELSPAARVTFEARLIRTDDDASIAPVADRRLVLQHDHRPLGNWGLSAEWRSIETEITVAPYDPDAAPWPRTTTVLIWQLGTPRPNEQIELRTLRVEALTPARGGS